MSIETVVVHRLEQTDITLEVDTTYGNVRLMENGEQIMDLTPNSPPTQNFLREMVDLFQTAIETLNEADFADFSGGDYSPATPQTRR